MATLRLFLALVNITSFDPFEMTKIWVTPAKPGFFEPPRSSSSLSSSSTPYSPLPTPLINYASRCCPYYCLTW
jgi:hypothetical protein